MERDYINLLKNNIDRDLEFGTTEIGPHRDDLLIYINNKEARIFGSQGQQRTVVLSLILSEVDLIKNEIGKYPVLLLDDVFSELDEERRRYLIRSFNEMQTIITSTDIINLIELDKVDKSIFYIENGKVLQ